MKKKLFIIIMLISLTACGVEEQPPIPASTPTVTEIPTATVTSPPTATLTLIPTITPSPTITVTVTSLPSATPTKVFSGEMEKNDYLIYQTSAFSEIGKLFFYDPATDIHIPILPDWEISSFAIGMNDILAFSALNREKTDLFILEYPFWENSPKNITNTPDTNEVPASWSPDGKFLLFQSWQNAPNTFRINHHLKVWDGNEFTQIYTFENGRSPTYDINTWSHLGHLAFVEYGPSDQVIVWEGNPEESAFSISKNQLGDDWSPAWSSDGRLAYLEDYEKIIIWNGWNAPETYTEVSHFSTFEYTTNFFWDKKNNLVLGDDAMIYIWDGLKTKQIMEGQEYGLFVREMSANGLWTTSGPYFANALYVHNPQHETIAEIKGNAPAWSPGNLLAFCTRNSSLKNKPHYSISIWDGSKSTVLLDTDFYIIAKWRNGVMTSCYDG